MLLLIFRSFICFLCLSREVVVSRLMTGSHPTEVYLLPGLYSGFTNQRFSFYYSTLLAMNEDWTLVLPNWKITYNDFINGKTKPFSYFYTLDDTVISNSTDLHKFKYAIELPADRMPDCLSELQCNSYEECKNPSLKTLREIANARKVMCVNSEESYFYFIAFVRQLYNTDNLLALPVMQQLRRALIPNPVYAKISNLLTSRMRDMFGQRSFVSVHLRVEEDFKHACTKWGKETWDGGNSYYACYQGEAEVYDALVSSNVPFGSVLLIMNGHRNDYLPSLTTLCGRGDCYLSHEYGTQGGKALPEHCLNFICVRKEQLWKTTDLPNNFELNSMTEAMLDFVLSSHADRFFGNIYSTMSKELFYTHRALGRSPTMFNRLCSSYTDENVPCP